MYPAVAAAWSILVNCLRLRDSPPPLMVCNRRLVLVRQQTRTKHQQPWAYTNMIPALFQR